MNRVEVSFAGVEPPGWAHRCAAFVRRVLEARNIRDWEVSILLCDDPCVQALNRRYRDVDEPTDVLAFAQQEDPGRPAETAAEFPSPRFPAGEDLTMAGDVVVSLETMKRNAGERGVAEEEELKRLLIHGILHLEGMDHPEGETEMLSVQERVLEQLKEERVF
ncbi:MAG: rRNA maturation RNase YbeY [Spirochaetales bacterium]|nr:rRNA maturation RNase YbeY [Spirochaetales bacterium]